MRNYKIKYIEYIFLSLSYYIYVSLSLFSSSSPPFYLYSSSFFFFFFIYIYVFKYLSVLRSSPFLFRLFCESLIRPLARLNRIVPNCTKYEFCSLCSFTTHLWELLDLWPTGGGGVVACDPRGEDAAAPAIHSGDGPTRIIWVRKIMAISFISHQEWWSGRRVEMFWCNIVFV